MIVLDATNKSLVVTAGITGVNEVVGWSSTVTYWSIDSSNVWTPKSFETLTQGNLSTGQLGTVVILPAPGAGEVSRVVENIWIHTLANIPVSGSPNNSMRVFVETGSVQHIIGEFKGGAGGVSVGDTLTLSRDGSFIRQKIDFPSTPTSAVNSY